MSLKNIVSEWLRTVIGNHLGRNIRSYKFRTYASEATHNMLGGVNFLDPAEGKVCETTEEWTLIKKTPSEFDVIETNLLSEPVNVGDKVAISYYQLRRFDGSRANGEDDPAEGGFRTIALTGAKTLLPVKWEDRYLDGPDKRISANWPTIVNPYLRDMVQQIEGLAVDGRRRVANVLVDAGATSVRFFDTSETSAEEPGLAVDVATAKFRGEVRVSYNRGMDLYNITLTPAGENQPAPVEVNCMVQTRLHHELATRDFKVPTCLKNLCFEDLGPVLVGTIDDGAWLKAKVTVLKKAPKPRVPKQVEATL